jgi:hypothetical protein
MTELAKVQDRHYRYRGFVAGSKLTKGKTRAQIEVETRERENHALRLRREDWDYASIAAEIGWASHAAARLAVQRALNRFAEEDAEALRDIEDDKLRSYERAVLEEIRRDHVVVSHGKIIRDVDGTPIRDSAPVYAGYRELRMLSERRAKLRGLDAPLRTIVEEITEDAVREEARRINLIAQQIEADLASEKKPVEA